jgi:hypothetical protein
MESIWSTFGIESLPDSPQFMYAVRLLTATYGAVGVFFVILALDPAKYGVMVPFAGIASVFLGVVCGIAGPAAEMPTWWFLGDSLSCLVLGVLILVFWRQAGQTVKGAQPKVDNVRSPN